MTVIIIFITLAVSVVVLQTDRDGLIARLGLRPYDVVQKRQWWRVVTHGFVHADYVHLAVNMITFFSFGRAIEQIFQSLEAAGAIGNHTTAFLLLYFGGMVAASVYDLMRYRRNPNYNSIGASGAVAAVIFASIFFAPWHSILFFGVLPIPGLLFGALYLYYEWYSARTRRDGINHFAHIFGALYGLVFPLLLNPALWHNFVSGLKF